MPYRTQSPTQDISSRIVISIQHTPTLTNMRSGTQSLFYNGSAARAFLARVLGVHGYRDSPKHLSKVFHPYSELIPRYIVIALISLVQHSSSSG